MFFFGLKKNDPIAYSFAFILKIVLFLGYNEREPEDLARFVIEEAKKVKNINFSLIKLVELKKIIKRIIKKIRYCYK